MNTIVRCLVVGALVTLFAGGSALAQTNQNPLFLRAGITDWGNLSQLHVGLGTDLGEIVPGIAFMPNAEVGFGDGWTILTVNGDLVYRFTEVTDPPWGLYGGGGLAFNLVDRPHGNDTDLGLSAVLGMTYELNNGHDFLMELRLGLMDSPDLKFTLGYSLF